MKSNSTNPGAGNGSYLRRSRVFSGTYLLFCIQAVLSLPQVAKAAEPPAGGRLVGKDAEQALSEKADTSASALARRLAAETASDAKVAASSVAPEPERDQVKALFQERLALVEDEDQRRQIMREYKIMMESLDAEKELHRLKKTAEEKAK